MDSIRALYIGNGRVRVNAAGRALQADQRIALEQPGASFCPLEWVAAALSA